MPPPQQGSGSSGKLTLIVLFLGVLAVFLLFSMVPKQCGPCPTPAPRPCPACTCEQQQPEPRQCPKVQCPPCDCAAAQPMSSDSDSSSSSSDSSSSSSLSSDDSSKDDQKAEELAGQASAGSRSFDFSRIPADYRKDCERMMSPKKHESDRPFYSQFRQDWFIYHNWFADREYGDGFYVDVGANHPKTLSNTLFFDKCLGWKGICVEPNPIYAKGYEARSCKLIRNCVFRERKSLWFDMPRTNSKGTAGRILNCTESGVCSDKGIGDKRKIECLTLDEILSSESLHEKPSDGVLPQIDMLSVDVEGNEIDVLEVFPFSKYNISLVTIEINKTPQNKLHYIMSQGGFYKDISVGIDDVFVRRAKQHRFPPDWHDVGPYSQRYHK